MIVGSDIALLSSAFREAALSPDPSTQNGAILSLPYFRDGIVKGHNRIPYPLNQAPENYHNKEVKYTLIQHAERAVIYEAARLGVPTQGSTLYVPWFACTECAKAIIGAGIVRIVGDKRLFEKTTSRPEWKKTVDIGLAMLEEAGVEMDYLNVILKCPPIRFGGELFHP